MDTGEQMLRRIDARTRSIRAGIVSGGRPWRPAIYRAEARVGGIIYAGIFYQQYLFPQMEPGPSFIFMGDTVFDDKSIELHVCAGQPAHDTVRGGDYDNTDVIIVVDGVPVRWWEEWRPRRGLYLVK